MARAVLAAAALALPQPAFAPLPRGAHPHEVKLTPFASQMDASGVMQDPDAQADRPYSDLIPAATEGCYRRLVQDPSCCTDEQFAVGVQRHTVERPGTSWVCDDSCYDTPTGLRGRDVMWVPDSATCSSPRILWVHGGSWWYGSPDTLGYGQLGSKLAALTGAVVFITDYPLIPVGNYSVILEKTAEALRWLSEHGPEGCGPEVEAPLFVGGDSAGGGTALSLVLEVKRRPGLLPRGRALAGALLWSPWTNLMCNTPEYYHHAFATIVHPRKTNQTVYVGDIIFQGRPDQNSDWFTANAEGYVGSDLSLLRDPIASPYFAREAELSGGGVPPLYFAVGGSESILGDSVVVAQRAASLGVEVQLDVYTGMWHVFPMYSEGCGSGLELEQAKRALAQTAAFVRRAAAQASASPLAGRSTFLAANADAGAAGGRPPWTLLNYELEEAASIADLAAVGGAGDGEAAAVPDLLASLHGRWQRMQGDLHMATFLLGAISALALQAAARRFAGRGKERGADFAAPLLA